MVCEWLDAFHCIPVLNAVDPQLFEAHRFISTRNCTSAAQTQSTICSPMSSVRLVQANVSVEYNRFVTEIVHHLCCTCTHKQPPTEPEADTSIVRLLLRETLVSGSDLFAVVLLATRNFSIGMLKCVIGRACECACILIQSACANMQHFYITNGPGGQK